MQRTRRTHRWQYLGIVLIAVFLGVVGCGEVTPEDFHRTEDITGPGD